IRIVDETLTQNTTLVRRTFAGNDNIPYIFGSYTIGTGVKLSVDPGLVLKFGGVYYGSNNNTTGAMRVFGSLDAQGNADSTVVFTELSDNFYGGNTYSSRPPSLNYGTVTGWTGITFENESSDALSNISHAIVKKGTYGIKLNSASPTLSDIAFVDNNYYGIDMSGASNPTVTSCDFIDNGQSHESYGAVNNTGVFFVDVTGSWWGKNSGPYHATLNPTGMGQRVFGNLVLDPWAMDNSLNPLTGDISLNGRVTAYDAALGLQAVASLITLNDRQTRAADVSGNDDISAMDASYILQYAAGLITWFPAEAENKRVNQEWVSTFSDIEVALEQVEVEDIYSTLEIPLYVHNVKDLYAFESFIQLDEQLEFVSFQQEGWLETSLVSNFIEDKNELRLTFAEINPKQQDALLGTLVLTIKEGTTSPELNVNLGKVVGNETNVTNRATSATVRVLANVLNAAPRSELSIYPNPVASEVTVRPAFQGSYQLEMIDLKGATVYETNGSGELHLNVRELGLENGTYILRLSDGLKSFEEKLIINQ
ncbi:MAG: T9SS type A sorting domain-containing protein, partial [Marinoscillum sp.]